MDFTKVTEILEPFICCHLTSFNCIEDNHCRIELTTDRRITSAVHALSQYFDITDLSCTSKTVAGCVYFEYTLNLWQQSARHYIAELQNQVVELEADLHEVESDLVESEAEMNKYRETLISRQDRYEIGTERELADGTWQQVMWVDVDEDNDLDSALEEGTERLREDGTWETLMWIQDETSDSEWDSEDSETGCDCGLCEDIVDDEEDSEIGCDCENCQATIDEEEGDKSWLESQPRYVEIKVTDTNLDTRCEHVCQACCLDYGEKCEHDCQACLVPSCEEKGNEVPLNRPQEPYSYRYDEYNPRPVEVESETTSDGEFVVVKED